MAPHRAAPQRRRLACPSFRDRGRRVRACVLQDRLDLPDFLLGADAQRLVQLPTREGDVGDLAQRHRARPDVAEAAEDLGGLPKCQLGRSPGRSPTNPSRSIARPRAICSPAARDPSATW